MQETWEQEYVHWKKKFNPVDSIQGYDFSKIMSERVRPSAEILDFGCGTGHMVLKMRQSGFSNVRGADPSELLLTKAPPEIKDRLGVIRGNHLPYRDGTFDFIYAIGVLHHIVWDDLEAALRDVYRVLKPDGFFLYAEPRQSLLRSFGHLVLLSPLARLIPDANALASTLRGEWDTYYPWTRRCRNEFPPLAGKLGFTSLIRQQRLTTEVALFQKTSSGENLSSVRSR